MRKMSKLENTEGGGGGGCGVRVHMCAYACARLCARALLDWECAVVLCGASVALLKSPDLFAQELHLHEQGVCGLILL